MPRPLPRSSTRCPSARLAAWLVLLGVLGVAVLGTACATSQPPEQPLRERTVVDVHRPAPVRGSTLYGAEEALADVLSGELEYLGTGRWPGIERSHACAFRNQRVLVVNVYCTLKESQAFRLDVYSPTRGRVRVYAEARGRLSERARSDYFTFTAESAPPPAPGARLPTVALSMSYADLRSYERQRYEAFLPGCFGGEQHQQKVGGCLGDLAAHAQPWAEENRAFLERASEAWYRVVRQMRELAVRYGRNPD